MFNPDYRNMLAVMRNERPARLPVYEHVINFDSIENITGKKFARLAHSEKPADLAEFFRQYCAFWRDMTYDTVSYEVCIGQFVDGNAISGGAGPIQTRADFEAFPWDEIPGRWWAYAEPRFDALRAALPAGMKAVGGVGNGAFELAEAFTGLEHLPLMAADDPGLHDALYDKIGWLMETVWEKFLPRYKDIFVAGRFGDDLGYKCSLLTHPGVVRRNIIPQYRRVIATIHNAGLPLLYHSCGCIFEVMEDIIGAGINAKHSNEDAIAPFETWIERHGSHIGLLGGFDMDFLCLKNAAEVRAAVVERGTRFRAMAKGYALGSGNSIPAYVPPENYLAMLDAARELRE
ncbi:MAG: hypothetical protein FWF96_05090, partial [Kiritimatiellaeota bacterium]|nr:hypothetical protein [Kiritimatiellota bacterium]